jgi:hypothetical protein
MSHLLAVRKGEDVMSTMTGNLRRTILFGVIGTLVVAGAVKLARADVASDKPGAILIFPKIVVDTSGVLGPPTDTEIQITNTSNSVISARCYLINSNSHCSNAPSTICTAAAVANGAPAGEGGCPTGGTCVGPCNPNLVENDFRLTLTKRQPVSWKASEPLSTFPCDLSQGGIPQGGCAFGSNAGSQWPGVQEDPFVGEIKCVEVDPTQVNGNGEPVPIPGLDPANNFTGDLKGEATIVSVVGNASVDARKYNAIGIQSLGPFSNNGDDTLKVGGPDAEYNGCPKQLIVDHLFDNAPVTTHGGEQINPVITDLTFIPCSEDLATQSPSASTLQFLVYNEFEQRFSTSMSFTCFKEVQLSDIDSRPGDFGNAQSIFNFAVQGTLTGQTKIRPVAGATTDNRVLAISEEFDDCITAGTCSAAANVNLVQGAGNGDQVCLEGASPDQGCTIMH